MTGRVVPSAGQDWSVADVQNIFVGRDERGTHPYTTRGDLSAMLDPAGYCGAAVVRESQFLVQRKTTPDACNLRAISGSVIPEESIALPVAQWAEPLVSLGVQRVLDQAQRAGSYDEIVAAYSTRRAASNPIRGLCDLQPCACALTAAHTPCRARACTSSVRAHVCCVAV